MKNVPLQIEHLQPKAKGGSDRVSKKKTGSYVGRVAVRATGNFNIQTAHGLIQGINYRCCKVIQRADGYHYLQLGTSGKAAEHSSGRSNSPA